jgi:hypothetical protein
MTPLPSGLVDAVDTQTQCDKAKRLSTLLFRIARRFAIANTLVFPQEGYALLTVLNRIGFGPHHAVDWVISRRFSVKIPQTKWRVTYSGVGDNETKLPLVVPLRRRWKISQKKSRRQCKCRRYRLLTCLNEFVAWQRSHLRPNAPLCTSSFPWQAKQSVANVILVTLLTVWQARQSRPRWAPVSG